MRGRATKSGKCEVFYEIHLVSCWCSFLWFIAESNAASRRLLSQIHGSVYSRDKTT
jgi:hypothetical protein